MKKVKKILRIVLLVIVVLVICVVGLIHFFGNSVLKAGIENAASETLKVGVSIDDMDFSILGGMVSFEGLVIDNPPGYQYEKLLEVDSARIVVSISSLLKDTVNIKEIMLDGVTVVLEQKGLKGSNLQEIIDALPKAEAEPEAKTEKPSKKLHIDTLEITNVTVKAKLLPIPGKAGTITIKLDPIRMTDLGSDEKMDVAKLSSKILLAIATGVSKQGAGQLPKGMTDGMKATLSKATELGKTVTEESGKLLEEGKNILEGFKGFLKPKK